MYVFCTVFYRTKPGPGSPLQRFMQAVYPSDEEDGDADSTNLGLSSSDEEETMEVEPTQEQDNRATVEDEQGMPTISAPKRRKRKPLEDCVVLEQELEDKAVDFIEAHPCLWFISDKNYKNKQSKQTAWSKIAETCNLSVEQMQTWWESQRDRYVREKRERESKPTGSGADDYVSSAKSIWLARRLAFYGKVCRHHRKSLKSIKAAKAIRENREPDPDQLEMDTNQDVDSGAVDASQSTRGKTPKKNSVSSDVLGELSEHLKSVAKARENLMKRKSTQEAYGDFVCTWIYNMPAQQFDTVQDDFNVYMLQSNKRFAKAVPPMGPPIVTTSANIVVMDEEACNSSGYGSRNPSTTPTSSVSSAACYNTDMTPCEDPDPNPGWQPTPERWPNKAFNPNYPLYQSQTKAYVDKVMARQVTNVSYADGTNSYNNPTNFAYSNAGSLQAGYTGNQLQRVVANNFQQPASAPSTYVPSSNLELMRPAQLSSSQTQFGNLGNVGGQSVNYQEKFSLTDLQSRTDVTGIKKAPKSKIAAGARTRPKTPETVQQIVSMDEASLASTGLYVSTGLQATNVDPTVIPETQQVAATSETDSVHVQTASSAEEEEEE